MSILIVGVGEGIGSALAMRFAREGHDVGLVARNGDRLEQLAATLPGRPGTAAADAGDERALRAALESLADELGPPEALLYNAVAPVPGSPSELSPSALVSELRVDVVGALVAAQTVLPALRSAGGGSLLMTGGGLALNPSAGFASLSVGKAALRALALVLHQELAPEGIRVTTLTINGYIKPGGHFAPDLIAERFWQLHTTPAGELPGEVIYD
ncbi:MAG: SDR family NAD(P)-dependent oxidoreductase [Thermoleophilaceae bacterium]